MTSKIYIFTLGCIAMMLATVVPVHLAVAQDTAEGVTVSVTPGADAPASDSATTDPSDLRKLRDRLASVVAQLRKKDEQVIAGQVSSLQGAVMDVETLAGSTEKITLDDTLTKYYRISGAAKEERELKDVTTGAYVVITGLRTDGSFTANEIYEDEHFESKAGRVTDMDSTDYTLRVETYDKETITVIVGRGVTIEALNVTSQTLGSGSFTQIREGDTVHIVYPVKTLNQQVSSVTPTRILIVPLAYFN